jgi:hypothetical protein
MGILDIFRKKRPKFGEILIEKGLATPKDVDEALREQKEIWRTRKIQKQIGIILSEKGVIGTEDIEAVLAEQKRRERFLLVGFIYEIFHSKEPK